MVPMASTVYVGWKIASVGGKFYECLFVELKKILNALIKMDHYNSRYPYIITISSIFENLFFDFEH